MKTFRLGLAAALATLTLIGGGTTRAQAAGDPFVGMQVLDLLCEAKGGTAYNTPFTISRCQAARSNKGLALEQLVCEGLLEARFASTPTVGRPNRTNWFCFPNG